MIKNNTPMIHVIGLGVSQNAMLSDAACDAIKKSDLILGSERQIQTINHFFQTQQSINAVVKTLPSLKELPTLIDQYDQSHTLVVLASGDPLYYGIGRWFSKKYSQESLVFYPAVSSIQAACHQMGLALQDVDVLSLHGRPFEKIRTKLHANKRLVVLTDKYSQPSVLAQECIAAGFELSRLTVCENLGYAQQKIRTYLAKDLVGNIDTQNQPLFDPLHITVIEVMGPGDVLPEFPGIPDASYITGQTPGKGMISKREVRLVILSFLQVRDQDIIWDIGAGCGGVAIEVAYWNDKSSVYAIEHHEERLGFLVQNSDRFGVNHNLHIVAGTAPDVCSDLPLPNKIFIGGSDGKLLLLLNMAWEILPVNGVLVVSAVIQSTKQQLVDFVQTRLNNITNDIAVESVEVAIRRGSVVDGALSYESKLPVEVFKLTKLSDSAASELSQEPLS